MTIGSSLTMGESTSKHRGSDSENGGRDRIPISPPILGVANAPKKWKPSPAPRATCQLPDFKAIKEIWQEQGWGRDMTNRYQKLTVSLARPFNLESGRGFSDTRFRLDVEHYRSLNMKQEDVWIPFVAPKGRLAGSQNCLRTRPHVHACRPNLQP